MFPSDEKTNNFPPLNVIEGLQFNASEAYKKFFLVRLVKIPVRNFDCYFSLVFMIVTHQFAMHCDGGL